MIKKTVKISLLIAKIVVTALFVKTVSGSISLELFNDFSPSTLFFALFFAMLTQAVLILRWSVLAKTFGKHISLYETCSTYFQGAMLALITPGRVGELLRGATSTSNELRSFESTTIVLFERFLTGFIVTLFGISAYGAQLPTAVIESELPSQILPPLFNFLRVLTVFTIPFFIALPHILSKRISRFSSKTKELYIVTLLSLVAHLLLIIQTATLLFIVTDIPFYTGVKISSLSYATLQFMPITFGNMGIREYWLIFFTTGLIGVREDISSGIFLCSLTIMISNLLLPALPGFILFLSKKIKDTPLNKKM